MVPQPDHPSSGEFSPSIQPKPALAQLEHGFSYPVSCFLGEEPDPPLIIPSCQELCRAISSLLSLLFSMGPPSSLSLPSPSVCAPDLPQLVPKLTQGLSCCLTSVQHGWTGHCPGPAGLGCVCPPTAGGCDILVPGKGRQEQREANSMKLHQIPGKGRMLTPP